MPHGRITRIEPALGFGFLEDDAGLDWFFVREGNQQFDRLERTMGVSFSFEATASGPRATEITPEFPQQVT